MSSVKSGPAASEQFTISRASLPSLLEWTRRLQDRFKVQIDIQWELEGIVQPDTPQVRWVSLFGKSLADCHAAKSYIITLCDPPHKLNVTYPEDIHENLKSSQAKLENEYSVVIQFTKIGQLLIKSQDQINMMLVLSYIESCASELENSFLDSPRKSSTPSSAGLGRRHIKEPLSLEDHLETDSILSVTEEAPSTGDRSKWRDSKHELKRGPLGGNRDRVLLSPQDFTYSSSMISPDRKMLKSSQRSDISPNSNLMDNLCTAYDLNARQKPVVQRILQNGEFTTAEVERTLERLGNNWKCFDFTELIHNERDKRKVPQTSSRNEPPSEDGLVDLKETQGSLIQSLEALVQSPRRSTMAELSHKKFSPPLTPVLFKDYISISDDTVSESEDPIAISSYSENDYIVLNSSDESDTPETFYLPTPPSKHKSSNEELHGVVEGLRLQLKELHDKLDKDRQEQQQQFQEKFLEQEKKLKAEQGDQIKKQIQEQQLKKKETPPRAPLDRSLSEDIVIAPARQNKDSPLRPVVIDGSNVAMCHGRDRVFSCMGIAICVQYFQKLGHQDIMVFVPLGRMTQDPYSRDRPIRDQRILNQLKKQGLLSFTPSRKIGHTYINCYDDRFIVELAVQNDGVIVSNDNYRDLMSESPQWKSVIENRLVMFTFAGDRFMIPDDPLGRNGPRIGQLLRKTPKPVATTSATHRVTQAAPGYQRLQNATRALAPAMASGRGSHELLHGPSGYQLIPQSSDHRVTDAAPGYQRLQPATRALAPAMAPGGGSHQLLQGSSGYRLIPQSSAGQRIAPTVPAAAPQSSVGQRFVPTVPAAAPQSSVGQRFVPTVPAASPRSLMGQRIAPTVPAAAPHWGAGQLTAAAHLFPQGSSAVSPVKLPPQQPLATNPVKLPPQQPLAANRKLLDPSHYNAASYDPRLSPLFKTLQPVFPDNEAEVLKVLATFRDVTELNDLSLLVLAQIRDGAAKT